MTVRAGSTHRFRRDDGGATAVEFAIISVPLLLILFGSVEFGRMLWTRQAMSQAVVAGARCMGVPQTECSASGVRDVAKTKTFVVGAASKWGLTLTTADVGVDAGAACGGVAGFSNVTITRTFVTVAPTLITQLVNNPIVVSACFPNSVSG